MIYLIQFIDNNFKLDIWKNMDQEMKVESM